MQFTKRIDSAGSTAFYFTECRDGGMSNAQQIYLADRIMSYRTRFASLAVNAVWDFGMEEGDPVRSDKYGEFELCRDNAVYNAQMLTISFNHARLRKMNCEADPGEIAQILAPWLRAKVENGLLKVWLSENAPEYVKNIYRNCYS